MVGVFIMRIQRLLSSDGDSAQLGIHENNRNYKKLAPVVFSREGLPQLSLNATASI